MTYRIDRWAVEGADRCRGDFAPVGWGAAVIPLRVPFGNRAKLR